MKKISLIMASLVLSANFALGASTEDFFYQKGYDNGYSIGYEAGVKAAFDEAKEVLKRYANELRAYETGKYLIISKKLSYPQVYQKQNSDGTFSLIVTPSKIEKELDVDGLFAKFSVLASKKLEATPNTTLSLDEKNSVYLNLRDANDNTLPQKADSAARTQILELEKSSKNFEILKRANVVFSDEGSNYNVLFFTRKEREDFCNQFKICK